MKNVEKLTVDPANATLNQVTILNFCFTIFSLVFLLLRSNVLQQQISITKWQFFFLLLFFIFPLLSSSFVCAPCSFLCSKLSKNKIRLNSNQAKTWNSEGDQQTKKTHTRQMHSFSGVKKWWDAPVLAAAFIAVVSAVTSAHSSTLHSLSEYVFILKLICFDRLQSA